MTNTYLAGALVQVSTYTGPVDSPTGGFRTLAGVLADPDVVEIRWRTSENGEVTTVAYPDPRIIKDGVGLYRSNLDTTGSDASTWAYAWAGTGGLQAINAGTFYVRAAFP